MKKSPSRKGVVIDKFHGYFTKEDPTKLNPGCLVAGSQNVLTNNGEKVMARKGYTRYNTSGAGFCIGSYDFQATDSFDGERHIRIMQNGNTFSIETIYKDKIINLGGFSGFGLEVSFAEFFDINQKFSGNIKNYLLMALGGISTPGGFWIWSGSLGVVVSSTMSGAYVSHITFDRNMVSAGFSNTGTVHINGSSYSYSGISTSVITNDTLNITGTNTNIPNLRDIGLEDLTPVEIIPSGLPSIQMDITKIAVSRNQVYLVDKNVVYISKSNNPLDFSYGTTLVPGSAGISGRVDGEGAILTTGEPITAIYSNEDIMYVSTKNKWYKVDFIDKPVQYSTGANTTSTIYYQEVQLTPIKTQSHQGVKNQQLITSIYNNIVFVSNEPTITTLGSIIQQDGQQTSMLSNLALQSISEEIKYEVMNYDITNGSLIYHKSYLYVAIPKSEIVLMYDTLRQVWEAPQTIPISCFNIIDGELYGNSYLNGDIYKLFDGMTDNGTPISAVAKFAWFDGGSRDIYKKADHIFTDGRINTETTLKINVSIDNITDFGMNFTGGDTQIAPSANEYNYIGSNYLGNSPWGTVSVADNTNTNTNTNRFHVKKRFSPKRFFEIQVSFSSNNLQQYWEILSYGLNLSESAVDTTQINK